MPIATVNPATGETVQTFEPHDAAEVERRIAQAADAAAALPAAGFAQRAAWMNAAADVIESDIVSLAQLLTLEMGKPIAQATAEVAKCAHGMRFYARNAEAFLADEPLEDPASVGVIAPHIVLTAVAISSTGRLDRPPGPRQACPLLPR